MALRTMRDLEKSTEWAYDEVSDVRVLIKITEEEASSLHTRIVIVSILCVVLLVGVIALAPWFTAFGPGFAFGVLGGVAVRRLHWLRNAELPRLDLRYRKALTEATEALQRQEERRAMGLLNPAEYAKIEREAEEEYERVEKADAERRRKAHVKELWDTAFSRALEPYTEPSPYRWL
jgi:hypothetical protein